MVKEIHKKIESLQNPLVKHLVKLKENKSYREKEQKALVFGNKSIHQIEKKMMPLRIFGSSPSDFSFFPECHDFTLVTLPILKKISGMASFHECIAEFSLPSPSTLLNKNYIIAFDEISDPGNLGTLMRTALALGWEGAFILPNCCDPFNDKAIKASKGASFLLPYKQGTHDELVFLCKSLDAPLIIADLEGEKLSPLNKLPKAILLLSHEGSGVKKEIKQFGKLVTIPLSGEMESLNVAAAGAIIMYEVKK